MAEILPRVILREELEALRVNIISNHFKAGQKASGRTAESLHVEVTDEEGILYGRKAFGVLETGRKGGRVPRNFQGIIIQWLKDKGIQATPIPYLTDRPHKYTPEQRGVLRMSYLIARKIRREGTRLYRSGGRNDIYSQEIEKTIGNVEDRMLRVIKAEIEHIKLNNVEVN
jgi:hypothetical protein